MSEIKSRRGFLKFLGGLVAATALPVEAVTKAPETGAIREHVQKLVQQDLDDFTIECWFYPNSDSTITKKLNQKNHLNEDHWTHLAVTSDDKSNVTVYLNGSAVDDFEKEAAIIVAEICGNPTLNNLVNYKNKPQLVSHLAGLKIMNRSIAPDVVKLAIS